MAVEGLSGRVALVTGASGDIGAAVAVALGACGASLILLGRDQARLAQTASRARLVTKATVEIRALDLADERALEGLSSGLAASGVEPDILVHAAGSYDRGEIADAPVEQLDRVYEINLRAPYVLTRLMLPSLRRKAGDVVFIDSSQALSAGRGVGPYAASHHGRRGLADSLRAEVNEAGIRVLSVFLGRTAGRRQEEVFAAEGRPYVAEKLMQPEDVAHMVVAALCLPRRAEVTSITIRPALKSY